MGFIDLEVYDRVNREALWQVLGVCKLLIGILSMYVDSSACVSKRG